MDSDRPVYKTSPIDNEWTDIDDDAFPCYGPRSSMPTVKSGQKELVDQNTGKTVKLNPFDSSLLGVGIPNYVLDPKCLQEFPPLVTPEQEKALKKLHREHPELSGNTSRATISPFYEGEGFDSGFNEEDAWIQTYSGRRFTPTNPYPDAIVIQDIAHALSMQCRFSGHCKRFYSVSQHSVLVSYICDSADALWGLLHDASEAYLVDVPRPLKRSGKLAGYIEIENKMQQAICERFGLPKEEPVSVKKADKMLLATEARDLMSPLHKDWQQPAEPLPFIIEAWDHEKAEDMFMKRFFELTGMPHHYQHYLQYKVKL